MLYLSLHPVCMGAALTEPTPTGFPCQDTLPAFLADRVLRRKVFGKMAGEVRSWVVCGSIEADADGTDAGR